VNDANSGTESMKNSFDEFGVYNARPSYFSQDVAYLLNIGITLYFANLPFFK
jgi:hypothetical protein